MLPLCFHTRAINLFSSRLLGHQGVSVLLEENSICKQLCSVLCSSKHNYCHFMLYIPSEFALVTKHMLFARCFYLKCLKAAWMLSLSVQVPLTLELLVTCTTNLKHTVCAKQSNIALTLWLCYDVVITSATVILWQWLQNTYISVVLQIWPQEFDSILVLFSCSEDFSVKLNEDLTHISALDILPTSFLSVG